MTDSQVAEGGGADFLHWWAFVGSWAHGYRAAGGDLEDDGWRKLANADWEALSRVDRPQPG